MPLNSTPPQLDEEIRRHKPEQEANEAQNNEVKAHLRTLQEKIDAAHEQQKQLNTRRKEVIETIKPEELGTSLFKKCPFLTNSRQLPLNSRIIWTNPTISSSGFLKVSTNKPDLTTAGRTSR